MVEQETHNLSVIGSIPIAPTNQGPLAQLAEHRTFNPAVMGSIPMRPTNQTVKVDYETQTQIQAWLVDLPVGAERKRIKRSYMHRGRT